MADRRAVLIPGQGYDTRGPLFAYGGEALRRIGFDVDEISWRPPADLDLDRAGAWVAEQVAPALAEPAHLLVGKSLGSFAAPFAADLGLPAVWLTPLLRRADVTEALHRRGGVPRRSRLRRLSRPVQMSCAA